MTSAVPPLSPADLTEEGSYAFESAVAVDAVAKAPAVEPKTDKGPAVSKVSQSTLVVGLATRMATFFRTPDHVAYADVDVDGHRETWPVRGRDLKLFLIGEYFKLHKRAPSRDAVSEALSTLEAIARYEGVELTVFLRVASTADAIYIDLCNKDWEAVEITAGGWIVVKNPPVRFRRASGMLALPRPQHGGHINALRPFVNAGSEDNEGSDDLFRLMLAWLVGAARPEGPFFILMLQAEQGGGKSTTAKVLRALTDPSTSPLRIPPRNERDAMIASQNNWVLSLDNMSGMQVWLADLLCCLSTGGGFSTRQLTTDQDEILFSAKRPVLINGIDELGERNDVNDRALKLLLPTIDAKNRRDEKGFWAAFESAKPLILGALYDGVSAALKNLPTTTLPELPRMADAVLWMAAAEPGFGLVPGVFLAAYNDNRREAIGATLGGDLLPAAIRSLVAKDPYYWEGSAESLLKQLASLVTPSTLYSASWPKAGNALSSKLRRYAPALRDAGIEVSLRLRDTETGGRKLRLSMMVPGPASEGASADRKPPRHDGAAGEQHQPQAPSKAQWSYSSPLPPADDMHDEDGLPREPAGRVGTVAGSGGAS